VFEGKTCVADHLQDTTEMCLRFAERNSASRVTRGWTRRADSSRSTPLTAAGSPPGPTIDPATGQPVGRFIVGSRGNALIEPVGGRAAAAGRGGIDTHTSYPNGSNYHRLNPQVHPGNPTPHRHGHLPGTGPGLRGQRPSIDPQGTVIPWISSAAHWPMR
jgi:hypothetical protein